MVLDAEKRRYLVVVATQKKTALGPSAPIPAAPGSSAHGPSVKDNRRKGVVEVAPSEDKDTCSGLIFRRKRKADVAIPVPSNLDGQAPSYRECPPSASSPRDIMVQEGRREGASGGDQWDPSADLSTFL